VGAHSHTASLTAGHAAIEAATGPAHWGGRVEHVGTQEVGYAEEAAEVAGFIERWRGEPATARTVTSGG